MTTAHSLVPVIRRAADEQPDDVIFTFVPDGGAPEEPISYAALDLRARAIAGALQERGARGSRVLLLYPPGLDYIAGFLGCLYAGAFAVPAYPPFNERQAGRVQAILEDASASVILTTRSVAAWASVLRVRTRVMDTLRRVPLLNRWAKSDDVEAGAGRLGEDATWICTPDLPLSAADAWRDPLAGPEDVAFLQYTSGSTAAPKGVMLTHGNLLHNLDLITRLFAIPEGARSVSWLPPYHDLGLIGQILLPLYRRMPTLLMPPESFLQRPLRWLEAITRFEATLSGGPNFAYDLCVRKIKEDDRSRLDLRSWRMAFNAAEPVRPETLARFSRAFGPSGFDATAFRPCYGMAEATLVVSFGTPRTAPVVRAFQPDALAQGRAVPAPDADPAARSLVGCGRSAPDQVIAIVDPDSRRRCTQGEVGEIWACGASVAAGYWRKPEASADAFEARIADSDEGPFLRTGDLGFLDDGELFVLGRLKDLIVVYGRKHHAEDIEQTVGASHGALRPGCGAAFGIEHDGQERLIVAHEVRDSIGSDREIFGAICGAVRDEHGLDVHAIVLLRPGAILKTSSGKVRRRASKAAFLQGTLNGVASWSR